MKKRLSTIITLLFSVLTLGTGVVPAFAADHAGIQPETGNLTIHKHWASDASQIGSEGDGTAQANIANLPVSGVKFDVYLLTPQNESPATPPSVKDGWTYSRTGTELSITNGETTHKYNLTAKSSTTPAGTNISGVDGIIKFVGLDKGFYYVEENLSGSDPKVNNEAVTITVPADPFIISVPMTKPDGTGWNTDVHVYPKNQGTTPEKLVGDEGADEITEGQTGNTVNVGSLFPFMIRTNIPSDIGATLTDDPTTKKYSKFEIWDTFDTALDYNNDAKVYVYKKVSDTGVWSKQEITPNDSTLYTIGYAEDTRTLTVRFTKDGLTKLADLIADGWSHVGIEFKAKANELIYEKTDLTVENKATITFENTGGSGTDVNTPTPPTKTTTGEINIDKEDTEGNDLGGGDDETPAEFQVAKNKTEAAAGNFMKVVVSGTGADAKIVKVVPHDYTAASGETLVDWIVRPNAKKADLGLSEGKFYAPSFKGVQSHTGETLITGSETRTPLSYWLVETKAPTRVVNGEIIKFNLLGAPVQVTFPAEGDTIHYVSETIKNSTGFKLPSTGSMGAILLTVAGIALFGFAYLMNRKKHQE